MLENVDFQDDLAQLSGFVTLAADKLQQNGAPRFALHTTVASSRARRTALPHTPMSASCVSAYTYAGESAAVVLRNYFASPAGTQLCEQTAFPSLVLDFLDKVRAFLLREELRRMAADHTRAVDAPSSGDRTELRRTSVEPNALLTSSEMERSIEFLMGCVQAIATNTALMEIYRCEVPNLIQLSAEEYPPSALFLRDLSSQALAAVSDKNFNAGLVWYLHDCGVMAKTVKRIATYATATVTTPAHAAAALEALQQSTSAPSSVFDDASGSAELAATAAAVSDALGLTNKASTSATAPSTNAASDATGLDLDTRSASAALQDTAAPSDSTSTAYCLASYDALVGIKSLVYILQKTCRHSLVLLGEFQSSGGYALLTQLLRTGSDADTSTLIYLFTLLLPLGTGFSGASGGDENMATIITCGARNVGAFVAMRDLLLKCISDLELLGPSSSGDSAMTLSDATKARDEQLILQLLTTILHVYTSDYDNFWSLEPKTQTLALVLTKLPWIAFYDAKVIVLRIVEYVCAAAKSETALPTDLLSILCSLFIECTASETARLFKLPSSSNGSQGDTAFLSTVPAPENQVPVSSEEPTNHSLALLLCSCVVKILQNSSLAAYRDELHAYGLLERGIYAFFVKVANALTALASADTSVKRTYLAQLNLFVSMWSTVAALMLRNNWTLGVAFRELQVHQSLYIIADALVSLDLIDDIPRPHEFRSCVSPLSVFAVFIELATFCVQDSEGGSGSGADVLTPAASDANQGTELSTVWTDELRLLQSGVESDLTRMLGALQTHRGAIARQCVLLRVLKHVLKGRDFVWGPWQSCQGHEVLLAILSSITGLSSSGDDADIDNGESSPFAMMDAILELLSDVLNPLSGDDANRAYFKTEIGYATIATCLATSGVLETDHLASVLNRVFELITGTTPPRNKIRNADAVLTLFTLVTRLDADVAVAVLTRLLRKLTTNDEVSFSRKKQAAMLVHAGVFRWLADPAIARLYADDTPLRAPLTSLILVLARDELTTSQLREFLRVVARGMPRLLGNTFHPRALPAATLPSELETAETEEVGLSLLTQAFTGSRVPHVLVGTHVKTRMASGYVHVVNSVDRCWPPSSGYSFACWVRFPAESSASSQRREPTSPLLSPSQSTGESNALPDITGAVTAPTTPAVTNGSDGATVSVALCEGHITIALDGDDTAMSECYCVLVGPSLTFFVDSDQAIQNEPPIKTLDVTAVASSSSELEFYFWSHEQRFFASCRTVDDAAMWLRAMQQSESISNVTVRNRHGLAPDATDDELLFVSAPSTAASVNAHTTNRGALDGVVCLLSVYSIESAGCYVRIYFEQTTGCLRVDTGSVSSGPNMNPTAKRMTATFKNIDMTLLRASSSSPSSSVPCDERVDDSDDGSHWHHLAFTHRKSVVGSSLLTLYIDGSEVTTKKLSYPSAPTTGGMQAFVGKDIQVCGTYPALPWSLGPAWLTEDVLSPSGVACMFLLGPSFSGQFSGHAYRSAGDWPEAHATAQLDRATQRRVDIVRMAKRLQLAKLGRASRRQWTDTSGLSSSVNTLVSDLSAIAESATTTRRDDASGGFRFPTSAVSAAATGSSARKEQQRIEAFQRFIKDDCAMSAFGNELLQLLSSFRIADDLVLFSLNTTASSSSSSGLTKAQASSLTPTTALSHVQIQYVGTERSNPLDLPKVLPSVGGVTQMLFPLLENAWRPVELRCVLDLLALALRQNPSCLAECLDMNGYALIVSLLVDRIELVNEHVLAAAVRLAISGEPLARRSGVAGTTDTSVSDTSRLSLVVDATALSQIVLSSELRRLLPWRLQCQLVVALLDVLDPSNPNALFNARQLRRAGVLAWLLLYVSELCNEDCAFVKATTLEHRWCFPDFAFAGYNELLQRLLALLRAYLRVENHVDDVFAVADMLLLSLTTDSVHRRDSPVRVVLLQFLLHEVESDAGARKGAASSTSPSTSPQGPSATSSGGIDATELVAPTLADAVLYRYFVSIAPVKKRKDKSAETTSGASGSTGGVFSPTASGAASSQTPTSPLASDGVDMVLLEIISRTDSGPFASTEALLALRLLLSLAQEYAAFAQYLFQSSPALLLRIKRAMLSYSTDGNAYIPLLAYVSNVSIKDTPYCDSVTSPSARMQHQQYALLPPPRAFTAPDKCCVDQVWELVGSLLLHNCKAPLSESGKAITVAVLVHVAYQTEVSEAFFTTMCASASTVFRIIVQCLVRQLVHHEDEVQSAANGTGTSGDEASGVTLKTPEAEPQTLQYYLSCLFANRAPESFGCEIAVACLDVLKTVLSRSLFERDEFAAFMIFVLECLDDSVVRRSTERVAPSSSPALADAQKCWLALLVHIVKSTQALSENCSLLVLRNACTLGIALSRYLVDATKHQGVGSSSNTLDDAVQSVAMTASVSPSRTESHSNNSATLGAGTPSCFGTDVLVFFLSSIRMCAEPHIAHAVGSEDQQFVYGCLVYCAQTVLLNELNGFHRGAAPSPRLLECLVSSKHLLLQQTKCSSVIVCGTLTNHHLPTEASASASGATANGAGATGSTTNTLLSQGGYSGRLNRMRSLSANAHKEFGVGAESDRSFLLSLAAELFRMLIDDDESVRHAAILTWQFLLQHRMGVLKELLIVEPRVSLLQNITTSKKEAAIDVFHGGFERLLHVLPTRLECTGSGLQTQQQSLTRSIGSASLDAVASTDAAAASANSRESWLQFHIWLTDNFDLLRDLILVRTEPIYHHLLDVLLSCLCVRKANSTSAAMRLVTQADAALTVDFALYFDAAEHSAKPIGVSVLSDGDASDTSAFRITARKTLFKLSNVRESSLDAMADAQTRWRETLLQLLHTRSVWQMEGWRVDASANQRRHSRQDDVTGTTTDAGATSPTESSIENASFYVERSIFQQNAFKHRLDVTEGPQRMRLRLVRSYESWSDDDEASANTDETTATTTAASRTSSKSGLSPVQVDGDVVTEGSSRADLFKQSRELHEAVEVFRAFHFKLTTHSPAAAQPLDAAGVLADIVSRATCERTREAFAPGTLHCLLCGDSSRALATLTSMMSSCSYVLPVQRRSSKRVRRHLTSLQLPAASVACTSRRRTMRTLS